MLRFVLSLISFPNIFEDLGTEWALDWLVLHYVLALLHCEASNFDVLVNISLGCSNRPSVLSNQATSINFEKRLFSVFACVICVLGKLRCLNCEFGSVCLLPIRPDVDQFVYIDNERLFPFISERVVCLEHSHVPWLIHRMQMTITSNRILKLSLSVTRVKVIFVIKT